MKKFMLFVLFAMLSGCATTVPSAEREEEVNPHASKNSELLEGVGGAILFNYIARMTGAGQTLSYLAGGVGAVVGVNDARSRKWRPGDDEIIHIDQSSVGTPYSYGGLGCNVSVACNQSRVPARFYGQGYCDDEDSGGYATHDDLMLRAQRRAGCYDNSGYRAPPQQHASYQTHAQVVYPPNLWERPEKRQRIAGKKEKYDGPTINDYMSPRWASVIPEDCRTGNYGRDSECLNSEAEKLKTRQEACEVDSKKCKPGFNFGQMAWYDRKLAGELRRAQDKYK